MDASVIICTYNRCESLKRTLLSLASMELTPDIAWEVIVVDNNSDDGTKTVIEEFIHSSKLELKYLFEKEQGKSFALNRGTEAAKGKVLAYTDDDVIVHHGWLENIIKAFKYSKAACVGGKIHLSWEKPCPHWLNESLIAQLGYLDLGEKPIRLTIPKLYGANFAIKSSVANKYRLFNTKMGPRANKMYNNEDIEFIEMLINSGEEVYYFPDILVNHYIPSRHMRKMYFMKRMFDQGELKGIQMGDYKFRNIFGIPLYIFKEFGLNVLKCFWFLIRKPKEAVNKQIELSSYLGFIAGRLKYTSSLTQR